VNWIDLAQEREEWQEL